MANERESFVVWVDRRAARRGALTGAVEQIRTSIRRAFTSEVELLRILTRAAGGERPTSLQDRPRRAEREEGR